ncbi:MAG: hypothetical protein O7C75_14455, partial [Verrucomicrobia bacterium]|nr:hypothetical protein [Verrucomicrobiota bacterium]
ASLTFEGFGIPIWAFRFVMLMVIMGFPIAIILAWAFELTPDGIKTTKKADVERGDALVSEKQQRRRNWFTFLFGAAVPTVIFGALAVFFYFRSGTDTQVFDGEKSIAVLPLENMSPDPENAFFADGVQEDILTNLARIEGLLVISRSSTLQYRNPERNLRQIGAELGVRYLVEGSVRRAGNQVLVTAQLIDTQTNGHLWAEKYDRSLDNIFTIQAEIAKEIAERLHAAISREENEKIEYRPTQNQEAYDSYVKFRNSITAGGDGEVVMANRKGWLEQAVSHDPEFAEAWARLAMAYIQLWDVTNRKDPTLRTRAHEAIEQAKRFGPGLPDIPFALSSFSIREDRDPEASIGFLVKALSIEPKLHSAHWLLGRRYLDLGRLAEAQHHLEVEIRMNPVTVTPNALLVYIYERQRQWENAYGLIDKNAKRTGNNYWNWRRIRAQYLQTGNREAFAKAIESRPGYNENSYYQLQRALLARNYPNALLNLGDIDPETRLIYSDLTITHTQLVAALISFVHSDKDKRSIEVENARTYFEKLVDENPNTQPEVWSELSICYALEGNLDRMESAMAKAREKVLHPYYGYGSQAKVEMHIAIAYLVLGDHDKAIETLEAASKMDGAIFLNRELELWFIFDRLRGNPRFEALLKD